MAWGHGGGQGLIPGHTVVPVQPRPPLKPGAHSTLQKDSPSFLPLSAGKSQEVALGDPTDGHSKRPLNRVASHPPGSLLFPKEGSLLLGDRAGKSGSPCLTPHAGLVPRPVPPQAWGAPVTHPTRHVFPFTLHLAHKAALVDKQPVKMAVSVAIPSLNPSRWRTKDHAPPLKLRSAQELLCATVAHVPPFLCYSLRSPHVLSGLAAPQGRVHGTLSLWLRLCPAEGQLGFLRCSRPWSSATEGFPSLRLPSSS